MKNTILNVDNITKKYKNFLALDHVSITIEQGEIFGLIGENGAGKTTLMRIIAGCSKATQGNIILMGKTGRDLQQSRKHMGVIIEEPAYYGDMNAFENLEIIRLAKGISDKRIVPRMLETVGLQEFAKREVGKFSLGMRQRLGLAIALIGSPEILILDEPTNGLDPNGIVDIRNMILRLNKERSITFLISSHILTELHQVAAKYAILHKGRLIAQYTEKEMERQCNRVHMIKHSGSTSNILSFINRFHIEVISSDEHTISFTAKQGVPSTFLQMLTDFDSSIMEYHSQQETPEEYFLRVTKARGSN